MALYPAAEKRLLAPGLNHSTGGMSAIHGVVVHVIVGSLAAADSVFHRTGFDASAHFGVGKDGRVWQWVDTKDKAWAEGAGNPNWISVETEGQPTEALTDAQLDAVARIVAWVHAVHGGFPLQVTDDPNGRGVGTHSMGGAAWGGHSCPGAIRAAQRGEIVRRAAGVAPQPQPVPQPQEDDMATGVFITSPNQAGTWHLYDGKYRRPVGSGENQLLVDLKLVTPGADGKPFVKTISDAQLAAIKVAPGY